MTVFPASAVMTAMLFHSVTAFCADAMPGRMNVVRAIAVNNLGFMINSPDPFPGRLLVDPPGGQSRERVDPKLFRYSRVLRFTRCPTPLYYALIASRPVRPVTGL